jgi:hypothetical protein
MNVDTGLSGPSHFQVIVSHLTSISDTQWAYLTGIRDFVTNKKDYLQAQVGNPDGADKPNKKVILCSLVVVFACLNDSA